MEIQESSCQGSHLDIGGENPRKDKYPYKNHIWDLWVCKNPCDAKIMGGWRTDMGKKN